LVSGACSAFKLTVISYFLGLGFPLLRIDGWPMISQTNLPCQSHMLYLGLVRKDMLDELIGFGFF
jgi:hypothetical protein